MTSEVLSDILNRHILNKSSSAKEQEEYALILGGGGTKGSYEAGVIKALLDAGIRVKAVYGTSIGALNGAFLAAGKIDRLINLWLNLKLTDIFRIPEEFLKNGELRLNTSHINRFLRFQKLVLKQKGLDNTPLREMLERNLSEEDVRKSDIHFGLVTYNLTRFRPETLYIEQIKPGTLLDYIMASANLPVFRGAGTSGPSYADGGFYDNMPFELALRQGLHKMILVDVKGLGRKKPLVYENVNLIYIKARHDTGSVLLLDKEKIRVNICRGYLDTLLLLGRIEGHYPFYFYPGVPERLCSDFLKNLRENLKPFLPYFSEETPPLPPLSWPAKQFLRIAGITAVHLNLPSLKVYTAEELIGEFAGQYREHREKNLFDSLDIKKLPGGFGGRLNRAGISLILSYLAGMEKRPKPKRKLLQFLSRFSYFKELMIAFCSIKSAFQIQSGK